MNKVILYFIGEFAFYLVTQSLETIVCAFKSLGKRRSRKQDGRVVSKEQSAGHARNRCVDDNAVLSSADPFEGACGAGCCGISADFRHSVKIEKRH